jgi:acyl-CoA reductase-like NAD-dependent aldehyde dehydrogenase
LKSYKKLILIYRISIIYIYFTPVTNPSTGQKLGVVPDMDASDTKAAIDVAFKAFHSWREVTAKVKMILF